MKQSSIIFTSNFTSSMSIGKPVKLFESIVHGNSFYVNKADFGIKNEKRPKSC